MTPAKPITTADIVKAGWEPEDDLIYGGFLPEPVYRATQGPFSTPWLSSWEKVLDYIKAKGKK